MNSYKLKIVGLDCANCALELERNLNKIDIISKEIDNPYAYQTLEYILSLGILKYEELKYKDTKEEEILSKIDNLITLLGEGKNE